MRSFSLPTALLTLATSSLAATLDSREPHCGAYPARRHLEYAIHRSFERKAAKPRLSSAAPSVADTVGNVALLEADSSIVSDPNPFDLRGVSLSFAPTQEAGRYRTAGTSEPIDVALGDPVELGDDDTLEIDLPFEFPFFEIRQKRVFLNSDGNLTFQSADHASTARSLERFLSGPPRIAPFFADLDPSQGGTVRVARLAERLAVTWEAVPEFDEENQSTFQVVLEASGRILFLYGNSIDAGSAVVGISSGGNPTDVRLADLSQDSPESGGAIAEKFQQGLLIDNVELVKKFYHDFPDAYDSIVAWTTFNSDMDGAFAFEVTTQNGVQGIGEDYFNDASLWGSAGRLETFVFMGNIGRYPPLANDPVRRAGGGPSTLGLMAHEFGHRWLARVHFDDQGQRTNALLGRQLAHWSFFLDSDASFLEGNDIVEEAAGRFLTIDTVARYSALDLYLMGFAPPEEVAPFFHVADGLGLTSTGEQVSRETAPQEDVALTGTKRTVLLDDILLTEGPRQPSFQTSPKEFRQAWILLYRAGNRPASNVILRLDAIRREWEIFFQRVTLGRARVDTSID